MTTVKLYHLDSYLQEFTAKVLTAIPLRDNRWGVILDRTAFYPEGGGQPSDTGSLNGIPVLSVEEKDGEVLHITAIEPQLGVVTGRIDWNRRFDHMQQHSGEHLLSAVFADLYGAENIGFHLGADSVSIDLNIDALTLAQVSAAEELANTHVFSNLPVSAHLVSNDNWGDFELRKQPAKIFSRLRLVKISDVDCCPCGGTHVAATGAIGLIKVRSLDRKSGTTRIDFVCGRRALMDYTLNNNVVRQLASRLSVPAVEIPAAVERQLAKSELSSKALRTARQELSKYLAAELHAGAPFFGNSKLVAKLVTEATPFELGELAKALLTYDSSIALLASTDEIQNKSHLLFACTPNSGLNMGELLKSVLPLIQGKGGGNATRAQGGGAFTVNLENILAETAARLIK
jgi:alanyl-tRNA synthetase